MDPNEESLLARLREVGGPDDARPEIDVLEERDALAARLQQIVLARNAVVRASELAEDVQRLHGEALEQPEALGPLREKIAARKAALGFADAPVVVSAAEGVLRRTQRGPLLHVPTGIPTLDQITRGGLIARRVHVIGGEPDAGKTALMVQVALHMARLGYAVAVHCVDEPREGIEDRLGQAHGLALEDLESGVEAAIAYLATVLRGLPQLVLVDQDEDRLTIERTADALLALAKRLGCPGAVLCIDSLQTCCCEGLTGPGAPRTDRERIELVTSVLKSLARRGLLVIVTSELGRASYKARPAAQRTSEMAAFKGSGAIEYAMTTGLVLSQINKGDEAGNTRVGVPKNKRGERGVSFLLERDPDRCTYTDRGRMAADEEQEPQSGKQQAQKPQPENLESHCERVRKALAGMPQGYRGSREDLVVLARGKSKLTRAAIAGMLTSGELLLERPKGEPSRLRLKRSYESNTEKKTND